LAQCVFVKPFVYASHVYKYSHAHAPMFIKKIVKLKSLGRFHIGNISGGEYARYTLFYGGNGRGKTTICAALRSFQQNDASYINERKTFGASTDPEVQLLLDSGSKSFSQGRWNATSSEIHIFDGHFVAENIHNGEEIDTEHRRNFYRVVVGAPGVALAKEIDTLDTQIVKITTEITTAKKVLQQNVPSGFSLEQFLDLAHDPDIDNKLRDATSRLKTIEYRSTIAEGQFCTPVSLPQLPSEFEFICAQTLADVIAEAQEQVQKHLARHSFLNDGEGWLSKGIKSRRGNDCPFCGQLLSSNTLLTAYNGYFSQAYTDLKQSIRDLHTTTNSAVSEAKGLLVAKGFDDLSDNIRFWRQFVQIAFQEPSHIDDLQETLTALRECALAAIKKKLASPLDALTPSANFMKAKERWSEICAALSSVNDQVAALNKTIEETKQATEVGDKQGTVKEINHLEAVRKRHQAEIVELADEYRALLQNKADLVAQKDTKKASLDDYDMSILQQYETSINDFLDDFGASFQLCDSSKNYVGRTPQSIYGIKFEEHVVNVASRTQDCSPSFRTTLSAGDKSTFALAFFLAHLKLDTNLDSKVVVFDDPFTSLDDFRREMTAKSIVRAGASASQIIVFSHDKHFLDAVRNKIIPTANCSAFQISKAGKNTSIEPWNIEREVKEGYLADHLALVEFVKHQSNDARRAVTLMRPLLEKYIRYRFPNAIPEGKWLGDMLAIIRDEANHPLTCLYNELDDINQFTAPFHHDPNTDLTPDEVHTYAKRTLKILGGA
jgi:wobble nucleotide-excising tRNase